MLTMDYHVITSKEIKCYPNNKPWVSKELKVLLNLKKKAFLEKDQNRIKETNKLLKLKKSRGQKEIQGKKLNIPSDPMT